MMKTVALVLILVAALVISGCVMLSSEIVTPKTGPAGPAPGSAGACFSLINESAHSANTGSSQQITVNGYVSNICSSPLGGLTVRGIFSDRDGRPFASAGTYVGTVGYQEKVPFNITINTGYTDLYTYRVEPVIAEQGKFF
jgi:hypothetical protein